MVKLPKLMRTIMLIWITIGKYTEILKEDETSTRIIPSDHETCDSAPLLDLKMFPHACYVIVHACMNIIIVFINA